jgi:hypothetical protein
VLELVIISTLNGVLYGMLLFLMASGRARQKKAAPLDLMHG